MKQANAIMCSKSESIQIIKDMEIYKSKILKELKGYINGDIDIKIFVVDNIVGYSVAGELLVNGEVCKKYDLIDLLFLDLEHLMLSMLAKNM